ncbi:MAG TPA: hypothetical protein VMU85_04390 [Stellaceae bacterium]|nr:hypothetical protein [Stellaceae bacterium]
MGKRRRITLFSKRGKPPDEVGVRGMGLLAGKGMYASRSPREGVRPLMEESPLTTMLGEHPAAEPPDTAPSSRVVILIELACFVMIAFVAGSALLFYGTTPGTQGPPRHEPEAAGTAALLPQVEPAAAPDKAGEKPEEEPAAGGASSKIELPPPPQVALAPEPRQDVPASSAAAGSGAVAPSAPAPPIAVAVTLPPEEIAMLVERGGELLRTGDIVGARFSYERAAAGGSGDAATGAGKTYDPLYLVSAGVRGIQGDPGRAASWYRKGAAAGNAEAQQRLRALQFAFPQ